MAIIKDVTRPVTRPVTRSIFGGAGGIGELFATRELYNTVELHV